MTQTAAPIGVFDSGVGGLTVLRALRAALPDADFVYLGDTARLPYGTKSAATVARYSLQCAAALRARGIGALVVACNTASASALDALRAAHPDLPVEGVVEPGAAAAVAASRTRRIAVIATEGTIAGGAYQRAIHAHAADARVVARACPLFVALAEEGWTDGAIAEAIARRYVEDLFDGPQPPDTLVLGCTHFPVLAGAIAAVLPPAVRIVDSAATTAAAVAARIGADRGAPGAVPVSGGGTVRWLATDGAARFAHIGSRFLGARIAADEVEIVDL